MQKLFLGICYLLISQTVLSQQIRGRVTDATTGSAVAAATVELGDVSITLTNDSGYFNFRNPGRNNHPLKVSSLGYHSFEQKLTGTETDIPVALQRFNLMMQAVEVRAIRAGDKAPFTKTNLSKKDI